MIGKKSHPEIVNIIPGEFSTLFISHYYGDGDVYNFSIVKNKYASNKKLQEMDFLIFDGWKIRKIAEWICNLSKENWKEPLKYFSHEQSLTIDCNCFFEYLITLFDYDEEMVVFEIVCANNHIKFPFNKKLSTEFVMPLKEAKLYFGEILNGNGGIY